MDDVLDPNVLEALRELNQEGEPDVVSEVLRLFLDDAPEKLDAIADAITRSDAAALRRAAHALKGAAGAIGAVQFQEACRVLEETAMVTPPGPAAAQLAGLRADYARVKAAIEHLL
jgi:HPt (histidine-containing phosphotransfer) domain-containing protein